MAQPTPEQLMRMLQRIDNKLNWLMQVIATKEDIDIPWLNVFDPLPKQPKDLIKEEGEEAMEAPCSKRRSKHYCENECDELCEWHEGFDPEQC